MKQTGRILRVYIYVVNNITLILFTCIRVFESSGLILDPQNAALLAGQQAVVKQQNGAQVLSRLLSSSFNSDQQHVIDHSKHIFSIADISWNTVIGLYFSAHWCDTFLMMY